jgi:hypothetical protein
VCNPVLVKPVTAEATVPYPGIYAAPKEAKSRPAEVNSLISAAFNPC